MQIEEIDRLDAETSQRVVAGFGDVFRLGVDAAPAVGIADVAELRRQHRLVAAVGNGPADQFLVLAAVVGIRGVDHRDARRERRVDGADSLLRVRLVVDRRHAHAAKPKGGDLEALRSETAFFHGVLPGQRHLAGVSLPPGTTAMRFAERPQPPPYRRRHRRRLPATDFAASLSQQSRSTGRNR